MSTTGTCRVCSRSFALDTGKNGVPVVWFHGFRGGSLGVSTSGSACRGALRPPTEAGQEAFDAYQAAIDAALAAERIAEGRARGHALANKRAAYQSRQSDYRSAAIRDGEW